MAVAWQGKVEVLRHMPDPGLNFPIPEHLADFAISGMPGRVLGKVEEGRRMQAQRMGNGSYVVTFGRGG